MTSLVKHAFGEVVLPAGAPVNHLYLLATKSLATIPKYMTAKKKHWNCQKPGNFFLEKYLFQKSRSEETGKSSADSEVLLIPIEAVTRVMAANPKGETFVKQFVALKLTGGLVSELFDLRNKANREDIEAIVKSVGVKHFKSGKIILEQESSKDRRLYVLRQGKVRLIRREEDEGYGVHSQWGVFGESAALYSMPSLLKRKRLPILLSWLYPKPRSILLLSTIPRLK